VLDMREEDDGLASPLRRELLACRRPQADLRLGALAAHGPSVTGSAPPSLWMSSRQCADPGHEPSPSFLPQSRWTWI
jgi:hypothetical protein